MQIEETKEFITDFWQQTIMPTFLEFLNIPNKSPAFDPNWERNGYHDQAVKLIANWCEQQAIKGMQLSILREKGKTPLLLLDIPGETDETILLYGHLDKQPEAEGWDADKAPWKGVIQDDKLYGRGSVDDGYAVFSIVAAIKALQTQGLPHSRCVALIESSEESGSIDLPFYLEKIKAQLNSTDLVVCLDSCCGNYDQLWVTNSLRGLVQGVLTIDVMSEALHSGMGGGIVPSTFRILRELLSRIEDPVTGQIKLEAFLPQVPEQRQQEIKQLAQELGDTFWSSVPFLKGVDPVSTNPETLILQNLWYPALEMTGIDFLPPTANAANVFRPKIAAKLSIRISPDCDPIKAQASLKQVLEQDPPYGAHINFKSEESSHGWNAPPTESWLKEAVMSASENFFEKPVMATGIGATIPLMPVLGKQFPAAQFLVTGLVGPKANAHGPNEFLHLKAAENLTGCIAEVIYRHACRSS